MVSILWGRKSLLVFGGLSGTKSDHLGGPGAGQGMLDDILQPQLTIEKFKGHNPISPPSVCFRHSPFSRGIAGSGLLAPGPLENIKVKVEVS